MKRPLVYLALFYIIGLIVGQYINGIGVALFLSVAYVLALWIYTKFSWKGAFVLPLAFLVGIISLNVAISPKDAYLDELANRQANVTLHGRVIDASHFAGQSQRLHVDVSQIIYDDVSRDIRFNVLVNIRFGSDASVGQNVTVRGNLMQLERARNPGAFDEFIRYKTRGIDYKLVAESLTATGLTRDHRTIFYDLRMRMFQVYDEILPPREAGMLKSMLLGERSDLDTDLNELLRDAGISHILTISGMHVSFLAIMVLKLLEFARVDKTPRVVATLAFLLFYCLLVGAPVSAVRATIMASVVLCGMLFKREPDVFVSLALSALAILIFNPLALWTASFQMSFIATMGLAVSTRSFEAILTLPKTIKGIVVPSVASAFATFPLAALYFHRVPLIGVVVNILIAPFIALLVGVGFLAGVIGLFSVPVARFVGVVPTYIIRAYELISRAAIHYPFAVIRTGAPSVGFMAMYYAALAAFVYFADNTKNFRRRALLGATALILVVYVTFGVVVRPFEIVFLDTGVRTAIFLHSDKNILIYGGYEWEIDGVVARYASIRGIERVETIFMTRFAEETVAGVLNFADIVEVHNIYLPSVPKDDELLASFAEEAYARNISVTKLTANDVVSFGDSLQIGAVHSENYLAVLNVRYNDIGVLVMGNVSDRLVRNRPFAADVISMTGPVLGTERSARFVRDAGAQAVVINTDMPNAEEVRMLEDVGVMAFSHNLSGAVTMRIYGNRIFWNTMK